MTKYTLLFLLINLVVHLSVAPPVNQNKKDEGEHSEESKHDEKDEAFWQLMEYRRYLAEVVGTLESDPEFRKKLMNADENDINSGKIADELEFVNHRVRTRLDELKREELERLRRLATKENNLLNGLDFDHLKIAEHLDHTNTQTFEIEDLKKLITKTSKDLAEGDKKRKKKFKEHEMQMKFEEEQKLKKMNEEERKKYEEELEAMKEKHKKHAPVHHPGSKQQLEEVWERQDHMENQDFDPRTFFYLHDVDGNNFWDQDEVKALFLKELDKLYAQGGSPEDLFRRTEEMERMREHVFNEADLNKDGLISYEEFFEQTKKSDFEHDEGWKGLEEQQIYTQDEYEAYEKQRREDMQKMIAKGMPPPHQGNVPVQHDSFPPQYVNVPAGQGVPHQQAQFQAQHHEQYQQQGIPQQQYPNQVPMQQIPQQEYRQQVPHHQMQPQMTDQYHQPQMQQQQQQVYPGQVPVQHAGQVPVQHQGQVPVQHQGQVPLQHQVPVQQMPVQQNQVPVQQPQQGQVHAQQEQIPVQHMQGQQQQQQQQHQNFQQPPNQPNTVNQVPHDTADKQPQKQQQQQQGIHRNNIHTAGKV